MSSFSTFLLVHVFTALLPPIGSDEQEHYAVLGLSKNARFEDIKKAYRKKSLELHPDKVAQRGQTNPEEAAAEYEKVQEAYTVLSDPHRRQVYQQLGYSNARYKFCQNGGLYNPMQSYENLGRSNVVDKTRLVLVVASIVMLVLLQPILICARVNQELGDTGGSISNAPWVAILTPTWMLYALVLVFWLTLAILGPPIAKIECLAKLLEQIFWLAGLIVLAQNWDRPLMEKRNWHSVCVPFYLAIVARGLTVAARFAATQREFGRMVSPVQFQREFPGYEQMSEEEQAEINKEYRVVQVDAEAVANTLEILREQQQELTDEDVEAVRITTSPEFAALEEATKSVVSPAVTLFFFGGLLFIPLVAAKLEGQIEATWWVVFIPFWILLGQRIAYGALLCCYAPVQGDQVIVMNNSDDEDSGDYAEEDIDVEAARNVGSSVKWATSEGEVGDFHKKLSKQDSSSRAFDEKADDLQRIPEVSEAPSDEKEEYPVTVATRTHAAQQNRSELEKKTGHDGDKVKTSPTAAEVPGGGDGDANAPMDPPVGGSNSADDDTAKAPSDPPGFRANRFRKKRPSKDNEESKTSSTTQQQQQQPRSARQGDNNNDDDDSSDDSSEIELDEETFRAFKKAQAEAEENAMNAQAKAHGQCCLSIFQLIMLCILVGKLEKDFDLNGQGIVIDDGSAEGYSAFWVMFPVFLVAGILLCCCSCLIYAVNGKELDDMSPTTPPTAATPESDQNVETGSTTAAEPVILTPFVPVNDETDSPATPQAAVGEMPDAGSAVASPAESTAEDDQVVSPEPTEDMNELD